MAQSPPKRALFALAQAQHRLASETANAEERAHGFNSAQCARSLAWARVMRKAACDQRLPVSLRKDAWRAARNCENIAYNVSGGAKLDGPFVRLIPISARDMQFVIGLLETRLAITGGSEAAQWLDALALFEQMPQWSRSNIVSVTFTVRHADVFPDRGYALEWAAIEFYTDRVVFGTGNHFNEPRIGGDTTSQALFECDVDGRQWGDRDVWIAALDRLDRSSIEIRIER